MQEVKFGILEQPFAAEPPPVSGTNKKFSIWLPKGLYEEKGGRDGDIVGIYCREATSELGRINIWAHHQRSECFLGRLADKPVYSWVVK